MAPADEASAAGPGHLTEPERPATASPLHGRRKGKKLRPHQSDLMTSLLPQLRLDTSQPIVDAGTLFEVKPIELWLEIGFGGGEHLMAEAQGHPKFGFIGCEPFLNGMAKLLAMVEASALRNIRLYDGDAGAVIDALPAAALDGIYLLYPDPWPKRRHHKRRFLSDAMLVRLARTMRPGAELRFATDIDDNAGWSLARILDSPHFVWEAQGAEDWRRPWRDWSGTRYEAKAIAAGRRPAYLTFRRR